MSFKKEHKNTTTDQKLNGRISKQELDQKKKTKREKNYKETTANWSLKQSFEFLFSSFLRCEDQFAVPISSLEDEPQRIIMRSCVAAVCCASAQMSSKAAKTRPESAPLW